MLCATLSGEKFVVRVIVIWMKNMWLLWYLRETMAIDLDARINVMQGAYIVCLL